MSIRTAVFIVSGLAALGIVAVVFTLGWWAPNMKMWQSCGADSSFALLRGIFEKPDALTCIALQQ